jgi:hypothetical protein
MGDMKYRQSRFSSCAKIDPKQLAWLKDNKDTKTIAGFLDKVINKYKHVSTTTTNNKETNKP